MIQQLSFFLWYKFLLEIFSNSQQLFKNCNIVDNFFIALTSELVFGSISVCVVIPAFAEEKVKVLVQDNNQIIDQVIG